MKRELKKSPHSPDSIHMVKLIAQCAEWHLLPLVKEQEIRETHYYQGKRENLQSAPSHHTSHICQMHYHIIIFTVYPTPCRAKKICHCKARSLPKRLPWQWDSTVFPLVSVWPCYSFMYSCHCKIIFFDTGNHFTCCCVELCIKQNYRERAQPFAPPR